MSLTKKELIEQNKNLKEELRRAERALNALSIDLNLDYNPPMSDRLSVAQAPYQVMKNAQREWDLNVSEPPKGQEQPRIDEYIRSNLGLGWSSADIKHLDKKAPYTRDSFSWCGAFAAFCYGDLVPLAMRKKIFPSTFRMYDHWARSSRNRGKGDIQAGDIVVVWTSQSQSVRDKYHYGQHITLCEFVDGDEIHTIEGNAKGELGDGTWGEGVIKRKRSLKDVAYVYRLLSEDLCLN